MDKHLDTMKLMLELSDTCLEGMAYIESKLDQGYMEDTVPMLHDLVGAFYQMEQSIEPIARDLATEQLEGKADEVREALNNVVTFYEKEEGGKAFDVLKQQLIPSYQVWKEELTRSFAPYVVS